MRKKLLSASLIVLVLFVFIIPFFVFAQTPTGSMSNPVGNDTIKNPFRARSFEELVKVIVDEILLPVGAVVAVVMIIYAGFLYVTARGDEPKITKAHKALTWAVIGAAILLGAWVISEAIQATVNELRVTN